MADEFKPASIDKNQPGTLHKNKDNRITVEFQNNQAGKPKVTFEGSSEDYKENDAVLFFDGESFRLERLHRAVKRLRHVRLPGESASAALAAAAAAGSSSASGGPAVEAGSPPVAKGNKLPFNKTTIPAVPVSLFILIGDTEIRIRRKMISLSSTFTFLWIVSNLNFDEEAKLIIVYFFFLVVVRTAESCCPIFLY